MQDPHSESLTVVIARISFITMRRGWYRRWLVLASRHGLDTHYIALHSFRCPFLQRLKFFKDSEALKRLFSIPVQYRNSRLVEFDKTELGVMRETFKKFAKDFDENVFIDDAGALRAEATGKHLHDWKTGDKLRSHTIFRPWVILLLITIIVRFMFRGTFSEYVVIMIPITATIAVTISKIDIHQTG